MNLKITKKSAKRAQVKGSVFEEEQQEEEADEDSSTSPSPEESAKSDELRAQGCHSAEEGDFEKAVELWQKALYITPHDHRLYELKAQGYLALDRLSEALQAAERAVLLQPGWAEGLQCLARCQREMGEVELSLSSYHKALALAPSNEEMSAEMVEVKEIVEKVEARRRVHWERLQRASTEEQAEVHRCLFHLSARSPPLPASTEHDT